MTGLRASRQNHANNDGKKKHEWNYNNKITHKAASKSFSKTSAPQGIKDVMGMNSPSKKRSSQLVNNKTEIEAVTNSTKVLPPQRQPVRSFSIRSSENKQQQQNQTSGQMKREKFEKKVIKSFNASQKASTPAGEIAPIKESKTSKKPIKTDQTTVVHETDCHKPSARQLLSSNSISAQVNELTEMAMLAAEPNHVINFQLGIHEKQSSCGQLLLSKVATDAEAAVADASMSSSSKVYDEIIETQEDENEAAEDGGSVPSLKQDGSLEGDECSHLRL